LGSAVGPLLVARALPLRCAASASANFYIWLCLLARPPFFFLRFFFWAADGHSAASFVFLLAERLFCGIDFFCWQNVKNKLAAREKKREKKREKTAPRAETPTGRGFRHATPPGATAAVLEPHSPGERKAPSTATRSAPGGR
jgi:polyferredoxin